MKRAGGAVETSRLKGFYKLDVASRVDEIARLAGLDEGDRRALLAMEGFGLTEADHMIENVIGILPLPIGVAANFKIDGVDRLVPMAIEEPSVVAAASNSARRMRDSDGIRTWASEPIMISQVQLTEVPDLEYGHVETPAPGPGYKGVGEGGAIGAPPAVINAVADALSPFGIEVERLPLSPAAIVDLLEGAS